MVFIPSGEPWNGGYVKSCHYRQSDDFLNINAFVSQLHARVELTDWHDEYNHVRRHSNLGHKTPAAYAAKGTCTKPG